MKRWSVWWFEPEQKKSQPKGCDFCFPERNGLVAIVAVMFAVTISVATARMTVAVVATVVAAAIVMTSSSRLSLPWLPSAPPAPPPAAAPIRLPVVPPMLRPTTLPPAAPLHHQLAASPRLCLLAPTAPRRPGLRQWLNLYCA